jgi:MFS family permease
LQVTYTKNGSSNDQVKSLVWKFVLLVGVVNLFADMTYEGARGITGAFLGHLGANGTIVGIVAGGGELVGYAVRSVSGVIADRTGRYWIDIWVGYLINMFCVPALALAGAWPVAAGLIVGERLGRGIRRPAMSTVLSRAGQNLGSGKIFGINEALDQIGGAAGPLIVAFVLSRTGNFHIGFAILLIPALITLAVLAYVTLASRNIPGLKQNPGKFKLKLGFSNRFWIYAAGGALFAAGYVDFALVAYHLGQTKVMEPSSISLWYAAAMIATAISAPILGHMLDRAGIIALAIGIIGSAAATPLIFIGNGWITDLGIVLWGLGTAVQDSLFVAIVADIAAKGRQTTAFGVFDTIYGVAWLLGSSALGFLYDHFVMGLVLLSVVAQFVALLIFLFTPVEKSAHAYGNR